MCTVLARKQRLRPRTAWPEPSTGRLSSWDQLAPHVQPRCKAAWSQTFPCRPAAFGKAPGRSPSAPTRLDAVRGLSLLQGVCSDHRAVVAVRWQRKALCPVQWKHLILKNGDLRRCSTKKNKKCTKKGTLAPTAGHGVTMLPCCRLWLRRCHKRSGTASVEKRKKLEEWMPPWYDSDYWKSKISNVFFDPARAKSSHCAGETQIFTLESHACQSKWMSMLQTFFDDSCKYQHFVSYLRKSEFQIRHPYKGAESTGCLVFPSKFIRERASMATSCQGQGALPGCSPRTKCPTWGRTSIPREMGSKRDEKGMKCWRNGDFKGYQLENARTKLVM